ncbi:hypothetical protein SB380_38785, partial [Burkholderia cenocepacia]|nr:hypothetical protein [Burkholderia cenocepacia]
RWSAREIQAVANTLNTRPRKTLGWKTPAEALDEYLKSVQQSRETLINSAWRSSLTRPRAL